MAMTLLEQIIGLLVMFVGVPVVAWYISSHMIREENAAEFLMEWDQKRV